MADPQTNPQTNWIEYAAGRRWDPATGQVQYNQNGQWVSSGAPNVLRNLQSGQLYNPDQPNIPYSLLSGSGAGGPTADDLGRIQMIQQMIAAQQQQQQQQQQPQQAGQATTQAAPSYWGTGMQAWSAGVPGATGAPGSTGAPGATGVPGAQTGGNMATTTATQIPTTSSLPDWQTWYGQNVGKTILVNGQQRTIGQDISPDDMLQAFRSNTVGWGPAPGPQQPSAAIGGPGQQQPESVALQQMAQIDPVSEALRQGLGASYLANLGGGPPAPKFGLDLSKGAAAPAAGDVQSYLNLYKQIDPQGYAQRVALAGGMDKFVQNAQAQAALGSKLDPGTIREVEQGTRAAQIARGNVYGTPQLVAETMARGSAGEQRMLQRQQMLQSALGQQQSYLGSGLGLGDVANTLYNQGYNRYLQGYGGALSGYQAQQNARLQSQGAALGYLGSGQTPYQAGAGYLGAAEQRAGMAAQGGPQYNPASLGQQYTGAGAPSFPQYGLDVSQLAGNWYNNINQANLQAYGLQQAYGQKGGSAMGAGIGALGGAASGALAGSAAMPGIGTAIGAIGGALAGGLSGYSR